MENEIKVNEYVRIRGEILQIDVITNITEKDCYIKFKEYASGNTFNFSEIKEWKHSPNLIDLIQCGDYVNGEQVCKSRYDELYISYVYCGGIGVRTTEAYTTFIKDMKEEEIETVVTKEQFESISYKVTKM